MITLARAGSDALPRPVTFVTAGFAFGFYENASTSC
jgi:hypothetical protein